MVNISYQNKLITDNKKEEEKNLHFFVIHNKDREETWMREMGVLVNL